MTTLSITDKGIAYSVTFDRWDALQPERARWYWSICEDHEGGPEIAIGDDLTTVPLGGEPMYAEALGTLLTFLSAFLEAPEGELSSLFPPSVAALGLDHDDIFSLALDIAPERNL